MPSSEHIRRLLANVGRDSDKAYGCMRKTLASEGQSAVLLFASSCVITVSNNDLAGDKVTPSSIRSEIDMCVSLSVRCGVQTSKDNVVRTQCQWGESARP